MQDYPDIEILAECSNGLEAVKTINELRPDLLFLDVQMPKLDGFEVLELVDPSKMAVVFVTAFDTYAMRAFEVHAVDYLLKPFSAERFRAALQQALRRVNQAMPSASALAGTAFPQGTYLERIAVKSTSGVSVVLSVSQSLSGMPSDACTLTHNKADQRKR